MKKAHVTFVSDFGECESSRYVPLVLVLQFSFPFYCVPASTHLVS
jgi:hypothetical protein